MMSFDEFKDYVYNRTKKQYSVKFKQHGEKKMKKYFYETLDQTLQYIYNEAMKASRNGELKDVFEARVADSVYRCMLMDDIL